MEQLFIPITNESWDQHDTMAFSFTGEFTRDFGPWKKGDRAEGIFFDFENGEISEFQDDGTVIRKFKLVLEVGDAIPY